MNIHIGIRPSLLRFATHCELVLRDNDHKSGWDEMTPDTLRYQIAASLGKMSIDMQQENPFAKLEQISDVENWLMFLFDSIGRDLTVDCDCGCFSTSAYPQYD